jgi:hypothetical protein
MRNYLKILAFVVTLLPLADLSRGAWAQNSTMEQLLEARKKALESRSKSSASSAPAYPQMSTDFMTTLQTLGIRPGMTVREARAAAQQWGAYVKSHGPTNLQQAQMFLTRDSSGIGGAAGYFSYHTEAAPDYRGAGNTFIPGNERAAMPGIVQLKVYPLEPFGDILDPDKLVVYYIETQLQNAATGVIGEADFVKRGRKLIGGNLIVRSKRPRNLALCEHADEHAKEAMARSQVVDLRAALRPAAWPTCGDATVVRLDKDADGLARGYLVTRFDLALAAKAYETFAQYGSDYRAAMRPR